MEQLTTGWFIPKATDICPHCGDTNFNETDRLCISCNHDHPEHNTLDCEQFCHRQEARAGMDDCPYCSSPEGWDACPIHRDGTPDNTNSD